MNTVHPNQIKRIEAKIADLFRQRDALMDEANRTGRRSRVNVLEANAALQQTILAGLLEQSGERADAERAARLRKMANGR